MSNEEKKSELPVTINKFVSSVTQAEAIEGGIQISTCRRIEKENFGFLMLALIKDFLNHFKRIRTMEGDEEIYKVISQIAREYYFLRLEEVAYCFQRMKAGHYVKILDCVDGGVIMAGIREYDINDRLIYLENKHLEKKHINNQFGTMAENLSEQLKKKPIDPAKFYKDSSIRLEREKQEKEEKVRKEIEFQKVRAEFILSRKKNGN